MGKRVRIFRNYCFCYLKKKKRKVKKLLQVLIAEKETMKLEMKYSDYNFKIF